MAKKERDKDFADTGKYDPSDVKPEHPIYEPPDRSGIDKPENPIFVPDPPGVPTNPIVIPERPEINPNPPGVTPPVHPGNPIVIPEPPVINPEPPLRPEPKGGTSEPSMTPATTERYNPKDVVEVEDLGRVVIREPGDPYPTQLPALPRRDPVPRPNVDKYTAADAAALTAAANGRLESEIPLNDDFWVIRAKIHARLR